MNYERMWKCFYETLESVSREGHPMKHSISITMMEIMKDIENKEIDQFKLEEKK